MPPELNRSERAARFRSGLEAREKRGRAVEAEVSVWAKSSATGDLPGASARLLLALPDAFRLRVASAMGVGLDVSARGDSFTAYVPRQRLAIAVDSGRESLGVRDPGALGCRFFSASWEPPESAWSSAIWRDSLMRLSWTEAGDTLMLAIGSNGLPVSVTLIPAVARSVTLEYRAWMGVDGVWWPALVECGDEARDFRLKCRIHRVRFLRALEPERLSLELPPETERLSAADLGRALRRAGNP